MVFSCLSFLMRLDMLNAEIWTCYKQPYWLAPLLRTSCCEGENRMLSYSRVLIGYFQYEKCWAPHCWHDVFAWIFLWPTVGRSLFCDGWLWWFHMTTCITFLQFRWLSNFLGGKFNFNDQIQQIFFIKLNVHLFDFEWLRTCLNCNYLHAHKNKKLGLLFTETQF